MNILIKTRNIHEYSLIFKLSRVLAVYYKLKLEIAFDFEFDVETRTRLCDKLESFLLVAF